ncbi:MAG TPA: aminopeptidase [Candidatus Saccharimonadales bacterium]|nr:aminopeptidase [Candidatus Saccharimonadales bacterium]
MSYQPSGEVLEKYAKVLVNFALGSGKGIKKGDVVFLAAPLSALPFYRALRKVILDSGGLTIGNLSDDMSAAAKYFYDHASHEQLTAFLDKYYKGLVAQVDHRIAVLADYDVHELDDIDPKKILLVQKTTKPLMQWFDKKENQGRYTWTLAVYGTPSMAEEAGLSLEEYWLQIISACYLDYVNPTAKWRSASKEVERVAKRLTDLKIKNLHIKGLDVDLRLVVGENRRWLGGGGRNIPSFEVFTSPDWRGSEGWIRFNQPLYYYGPKVEGIELHFKNGRVVKSSAKKRYDLLKTILTTDKGAAQIGEFSLTDNRLSKITKFMAETLYDENIGGPYGNTHLAVGKSYHDTYTGDTSKMNKVLASKLGFNDSAVHVDMISTTDRTVTATIQNGKSLVIYKNGQFTV